MRNRRSSIIFMLLGAALGSSLALGGCGGEKTSSPPDTSCRDLGDICTILGTGQRARGDNEKPPLETSLYFPTDVTFDAQGRLIVLDYNNFYVRRLDADGIVRWILGTGDENYIEDGSTALETPLHHAYSFAYDAAGNLYVAGNHVSQIFRMATDDRVWVVAGTAVDGYNGDGGNALDAEMHYPCGVAVAASGYPIFVADTYNDAVRVIDETGTIRALAGTGAAGYSGDGGPAENAQLSRPYRVRYDETSGNLYIADRANHVIRKVDVQGIITTVAGTGTAGYNGDGIPAAQARLSQPLDCRVGPDGALYIADAANNRVRRVDLSSGIITTVAGTGVEGNSGDGGPAIEAELHFPTAVCFDAGGNLWVSDSYNSTIRKILLNP
jgi:sugar lactone lactonase YvrE